MTCPLPPLVTRSRPWSKNWPKSVNQELNGADRPTSGADVGDEEGVAVIRGDLVGARGGHGGRVGGDWSTIRLLTRRGSVSVTVPRVGVGAARSGLDQPREDSSRRRPTVPGPAAGCCRTRRRCAGPRAARGSCRCRGSGSRRGRSASPHGLPAVPGLAAWCSEIWICRKMCRRSEALRLNPCPTGAATAAGAVSVGARLTPSRRVVAPATPRRKPPRMPAFLFFFAALTRDPSPSTWLAHDDPHSPGSSRSPRKSPVSVGGRRESSVKDRHAGIDQGAEAPDRPGGSAAGAQPRRVGAVLGGAARGLQDDRCAGLADHGGQELRVDAPRAEVGVPVGAGVEVVA